MPKISVLVPIFNVEKYLEECLDSIVNQTLSDIEIICINDGSTDSSPEIIKRYAKNDSRFIVINKKNSGYGDSMNRGLAKATGEYIGIVESDDFIENDMYEKLYALAKRHEAEVVKSNFFYYYTDLSEKSPQWNSEMGAIYNRDRKRVIKKHNEISRLVNPNEVGRVINPRENRHIFYQKPAIWSAIYQRSFLSQNKITFLPTPGASYQDTGFSFKVWASAKRAVFTEEAFLHYRQDNEASSVNSPGKVFCIADEYHEIESFLKKNSLIDELGPMAQATKYGGYSWNFKRLTNGLDGDFLKLFSKEYKEADKSGALDYDYFDSNMRRDLDEIINNPKMFLKRKKAKENAKISIIVAVYNAEKYLARCLDSLTNQSMEDIEIVCVNDGSSDGSLNILEEYYKKDARIVIRSTANRGPAAARNHAVAHSSGDYLMFCDSDDTFSPDACETLYDAISKNETDLAVSKIKIHYSTPELAAAYRRTDEDYYKVKYDGKMTLTDTVIKNTDASLCNKIFKSSLQKKYDIWFPAGHWYEDAKFFNDYTAVCSSAYYLRDKETYNYFRRPGSIMSTTASKTSRALDHTKIMMLSFEFLKRNDLFKTRYKLFLSNFPRYYDFSRRHLPSSKLESLHELVRSFIKRNRSYFDSIDPMITKELESLLPHVPAKTRLKRAVKSSLKKPIVKTFSFTSPTYRRQSSIMAMINGVDKKIDATDKLNAERVTKLSEQIALLQQSIDELKAKK